MPADEYAFGLILNETAFVRMFLGECCLLFVYIFLVCQSYVRFDYVQFTDFFSEALQRTSPRRSFAVLP